MRTVGGGVHLGVTAMPATLLWTSGATSSMGDGIRLVAFPLLAVTLTRDPVAVAGLTTALTVPQLVFGFHVGAFVDQVDRVRLIRNIQIGRLLVVLAIVALVSIGAMTLEALYVLAVVLGVAELFADTSLQALTPDVVANHELEHVNSRLSGGQSVGEDFLGPAVGGLLFALARWLPFAIDALSFAVSALLFERLRSKLPERPRRVKSGQSLTRQAAEGFRFLVNQPVLRFMALWVAIVNAAVGAASATLILYATQTLGITAATFGLFLTGTGLGALFGAFASNRLVQILGRTGTMFSSSILAGVATWGVGLTTSAYVVYGLLILTGLAGVSFSIVGRSLRQSVTPNEMMGRVTSVYRLIGFGAVPAGSLLGGLLAKVAGLDMPFVVAGIAIITSTLIFGSCVIRAHHYPAALAT